MKIYSFILYMFISPFHFGKIIGYDTVFNRLVVFKREEIAKHINTSRIE